MRGKILEGKVDGVTNPNEASKIVKQGSVTYQQAKNIARAGNIDSLVFDVKTQSVSALSSLVFRLRLMLVLCCFSLKSERKT